MLNRRFARTCAGKLVDGVHVEDMGIKSVGNDLDNAAIRVRAAYVRARVRECACGRRRW